MVITLPPRNRSPTDPNPKHPPAQHPPTETILQYFIWSYIKNIDNNIKEKRSNKIKNYFT
jgi:hypothetical protein